MPKLTLADIADLRAYEREREGFRRKVIELRRLRRVAVGPVISVSFENSMTIRFQVQEMVRAERILSDDRVQAELDTYNPLIPEPGNLRATLFLELTTEEELRHWLPKLVGIERSVGLRLGDSRSDGGQILPAFVEADHQAALTRETVTASVHYIGFRLNAEEVEAFGRGPVALVIDHPRYQESTELSEATRQALEGDLRHGG